MLIYWILLLVPGAVCVLLRPMDSRQRNRIAVSAFFIILLGMLMLRSERCGIDLSNYKYYFMRFADMSWEELKYYDLELGYKIYVKIMTELTDNYQVFLAVTAAICLVPMAWLYLKNSDNPFLLILLYVNMSIFPMIFSGLRQSIAIAIGVFAYEAVRDKKPMRALLFSLLAFQFHESAFLLFLLYPLYHVRIKQKELVWILPLLAVVFIFKTQIFQILGKLAALLGISYVISITSTGAFMTVILFFLFYIFSMVAADEENADAELFGLRNIMLLALVIQIFSSLHHTVTRVGYYTLVYIPMLLPKVLSKPKYLYSEIAKLAHIIFVVFFFVYFLYEAYKGADILQIYPYVPFWEG